MIYLTKHGWNEETPEIAKWEDLKRVLGSHDPLKVLVYRVWSRQFTSYTQEAAQQVPITRNQRTGHSEGWLEPPQAHNECGLTSVIGKNSSTWNTVHDFNRRLFKWKAIHYRLFWFFGTIFRALTTRTDSLRARIKISGVKSLAKAGASGPSEGLSGLRVWTWRADWPAATLLEREERGSVTFPLRLTKHRSLF